MPKNYETRALDYYVSSAEPKLRTYFGNVVKGQPKVYDTPFARGETTQELLDAWQAILESINDRWPSLVEFENDLRSKVGPMSVMLPLEERRKDIEHYYDDILLSSEPVDERALKAVLREFAAMRGLRLRSQSRTVALMKKSTNSGLPYFSKRKDVVDKSFPAFIDGYSLKPTLITKTRYGRDAWSSAAVLGWRGQEGGPTKADVKQRVIWMFPFSANIAELQVYQPMIEAAQRFNLIPAWVSMEAVDVRITKLFDSKDPDDLVVCTDFSRFDQHFNEDMQQAANKLLRGLGVNLDWISDIFPLKYRIPMMYNLDEVRTGYHGMASGSGGTNADETLVHRALQYEAAQRKGAFLNPNSQCLGDDGILTYPGITVKDVVDAYSSHGQEMNTSKQYASSQDCIYLRRWHHKDYRIGGVCAGVYSTYRALGRLRYLERFQDPKYWGPRMVALRQLSIIENVKYHPLREEFAEFCMKRDKYRLGIDIPGFLDNIENEALEAMDHMPDFLGYTKTLQSGKDLTGGIASWWIVNYLKSK